STRCVTGDNVQVEGLISAKTGSSITVDQQGKGPFLCTVSGGTRIRKGNTNYTMSQLQVGWRVHVSGHGTGESGGMCQVAAAEIKVQSSPFLARFLLPSSWGRRLPAWQAASARRLALPKGATADEESSLRTVSGLRGVERRRSSGACADHL